MHTMLKKFIAKSAYGAKCLKTSDPEKICVCVPDRGVQLMIELDGLSVEIRKKGSRNAAHSCFVLGVEEMDRCVVNAIDSRIKQMIEKYASAKPKDKLVMQAPLSPYQVLTYFMASRLQNTVGVSDVEFYSVIRPRSAFAGYWGTTFTFMKHEFIVWFDANNHLYLKVVIDHEKNFSKDLSSDMGECAHVNTGSMCWDKILVSVLTTCKRYVESQDKAVKIKKAQNDLEVICKRYGITKADLLGKGAK